MPEESKRKLHLVTIVYWVLLLYIIAALIWWFLSLMHQNDRMYQFQKQELEILYPHRNLLEYQKEEGKIESAHRRNKTKYISEGITFFVLTIVGAIFVYRSVRRQFKMQRQQQNFVMAITHELKTPIAVSRLNLETLLKYQLDDEKKKKLLQMTLQETLRLDTLINNILISSQLDAHSYKAGREELDFSDLTADVIHQFTTRYPEKPFKSFIEPGLQLKGDPLLLKLLLSNLLENANKYSEKEKPVRLTLKKKEGTIKLEVTDEGPGIPNDEKKNVFEKFYRLGNEQTRRAKGTGLGLYLAKKIAQDHGGFIRLEDNQPQGSKFIVHLQGN